MDNSEQNVTVESALVRIVEVYEHTLTRLTEDRDALHAEVTRLREQELKAWEENRRASDIALAKKDERIEALTQERDKWFRLYSILSQRMSEETEQLRESDAEVKKLTRERDEARDDADRQRIMRNNEALAHGADIDALIIARAEQHALAAQINAFWQMVESGWEIEPRAYFEAEAPKMGYGSPLAMAAHHMWKRELKDSPIAAQIAALRQAVKKAQAIYDNAGEGDSAEHLAYEMYTALTATEEGTK